MNITAMEMVSADLQRANAGDVKNDNHINTT